MVKEESPIKFYLKRKKPGLYIFQNEWGSWGYIEAENREEAKEKIRMQEPKATFFR